MKAYFIFLFLLVSICFTLSWAINQPYSQKINTDVWLQKQLKTIKRQTANIDTNVLKLSLIAYQRAHHLGLEKKQILTVIDYSKPSTEKRLWVFDLQSGKTLFNTWVSHGKNSGGVQATSFSNLSGSLKSSLGVFLTADTYQGSNGFSLKIKGLEPGVNDHAYERAIVIHGARYVNPDIIKRYGHIGRSWGCPAVSSRLAKSIINTIKEKTLVFAYYPDRKWLTHSAFLTG